MDFAQLALGNLVGIAAFALVAAAVMKIFQMATTLSEIKDLLGDIKRNTVDHGLPGLPTPSVPAPALYTQSGDEMLRALSAVQEPSEIVQPEIIQPR